MDKKQYIEWISSLTTGIVVSYSLGGQLNVSTIVTKSDKHIKLQNGLRFFSSNGNAELLPKCFLVPSSEEKLIEIQRKQHLESLVYMITEFFSDSMWPLKLDKSSIESIYEVIKRSK